MVLPEIHKRELSCAILVVPVGYAFLVWVIVFCSISDRDENEKKTTNVKGTVFLPLIVCKRN